MAESEVRQKFEAWKSSLLKCAGYAGGCEGDLEGMKHEPNCPLSGKQFATHFDAFEAGMRAGEIARWIPVEEKGVPTTFGEYLVIQEGYKNAIPADFIGGGFFTIRGYGYDSEIRELHGVTHWQPLPAAPEEKK